MCAHSTHPCARPISANRRAICDPAVHAGMASTPEAPSSELAHNMVICVGDLHGNLHKLRALWESLKVRLGAAALSAATVLFLGDYCDRGPDTRGVIEMLLELERTRAPGRTLFIAGNHDLGFGSYLGERMYTAPPSFNPDYTMRAEEARFSYAHPVDGGMHRIGRRWGEGQAYESKATFRSYGVRFRRSPEGRAALQAAVPDSHKRFLARLPWVVELDVPWTAGHITAVHAGLDTETAAEPQLVALRERNIAAKVLQTREDGRIDALSGRAEVFQAHSDIAGVLVSGHHGQRYGMDCGSKLPKRIIVDYSGGSPAPEHPLEAVVLPQMLVVSSLDLPGAEEEQRRWVAEQGAWM